MVHFVEIFLFKQFVISPPGFLRYNDGLVQILFQSAYFIFKWLTFDVLIRYFIAPFYRVSFLNKLIPFLLKVI